MAAEHFNSFGGFSAGIPPVPVIDANGNVVSNFNNLSGNVSANIVYANQYKYANGQPFNASPAGTTTQLQYNNNGVFGGIPNASFNGNMLTLGDVSTLSIGGGLNGYFLQTDGIGGLTWAPGGNGAPSVSPAPTGTIVGTTDTQTLTNKIIQPRIVTTTGDSTWTVNTDVTDIAYYTANTNGVQALTIAFTGTPFNGQRIILTMHGTGTPSTYYTLTYGGSAGWSFSSDLPQPTQTTTGTDYQGFIYDSSLSKWCLLSLNRGFT